MTMMPLMITCRWAQDRILLYLAGELDPRLAAALATHLEHCGRCRRVAEALTATQEAIVTTVQGPVPPTPPTLDARVLSAIRALPPPAAAPNDVPAPRLPRLALRLAMGTLLVGIGFGFGRWTRQPSALPAAKHILELTAVDRDDAALRRMPRPETIVGADADRVAAALQPQIPFRVTPVRLSDVGGRLRGGRKCSLTADCPAAVLLYDWNGERVTLYETDARRIALPGMKSVTAFSGRCFLVGERNGVAYALWCDGTTNFALVAHTSTTRLLHLASAAAAATDASLPRTAIPDPISG